MSEQIIIENTEPRLVTLPGLSERVRLSPGYNYVNPEDYDFWMTREYEKGLFAPRGRDGRGKPQMSLLILIDPDDIPPQDDHLRELTIDQAGSKITDQQSLAQQHFCFA